MVAVDVSFAEPLFMVDLDFGIMKEEVRNYLKVQALFVDEEGET